MTTTFDVNSFVSEQDLAVSTEISYAQWLNPQADCVGLALKETEAKKASFTPDKTWNLKEVLMGNTVEKMWVSGTPRLVILNAVNTIAKGVKGKAKPYFDFKKEKNGVEYDSKYSPILFLIVNENNKIVSNPIVLRPKKSCVVLFAKYISQEWVTAILSYYEQYGKTFGAEKPASIFYARHIFEPTFHKTKLANKANQASQAWVCNGHKPIDFKNFFPVDSEEGKIVSNYVMSLPDLLTAVKGNTNEVTEEVENNNFNVDDFTDPETGEVVLPLNHDKIPF